MSRNYFGDSILVIGVLAVRGYDRRDGSAAKYEKLKGNYQADQDNRAEFRLQLDFPCLRDANQYTRMRDVFDAWQVR